MQRDARRLVADLSLAMSAALLPQHAPHDIGVLFCEARLASPAATGLVFGALPDHPAAAGLIERALPDIG